MTDFKEMRGAQRFTLLIRTAKLVCESGEFICVVRDVSETGVRVRLFHDMPKDTRMALELGNGEVYFIERVWEKDSHAGFQFSAPIDVQDFIAEVSPYPRRQMRLRMNAAASISLRGEAHESTIRDLSQNGARIETKRIISIGQRVKLDSDHFPGVTGIVCWRSGNEFGMVFEQFCSLENFAKLAADMQLSGKAKHMQVDYKAPIKRFA